MIKLTKSLIIKIIYKKDKSKKTENLKKSKKKFLSIKTLILKELYNFLRNLLFLIKLNKLIRLYTN